ncbi:histidine phosphatase family protein [Streptomyces sp. NPDC006798]|uniref:histidine phosphatase family protein n=1 Tax=Streptomyces sp. NPDC006798 TaxID=3155462 RepID=UPI0033E4314B
MATLILVRHGRSTANTAAVLAGRTPGVALDERGVEQAAALPGRLAAVSLAVAVTSPQQRCRETLAPLLAARPGLEPVTDDRIAECDYGDWSGRKLAELADEPLMEVVQHHPSAAVFPGGESMRAMQQRAVEAVRDWDARVTAEHGPDATYLMCTHGDIVKAIVADALGLHLDLFQRLHAEPCSVTAVRYTRTRPFLLRLGDTGELGSLGPRSDRRDGGPGPGEEGAPEGNAVVGGGAGAP